MNATLSKHSREESKSADSRRAIDGKITPVERENPADSFPLGNTHKSGIGEIHRQIVILLHQFTHTRHVVDCQRQDVDGPTLDDFPQRPLRRSRSAEKVHRFSQGRPNGADRFFDAGKGGAADGMVTVADTDQCDERTGVDQDHFRFPVFSCMSSASC